MSSGVKGADELNIQVRADNQLDTLAAFDELSALAGASGRWIAGLHDVQKAVAGLSARPSMDEFSVLAPVVSQHDRHVSGLPEHASEKLGLVSAGHWTGHTEGKSFRLAVSPGTVALSTVDTNKAEKAAQRAYDAHFSLVELAAGWVDELTGELSPDAVFEKSELTGSAVVSWSKRSRMRMVRAVAELDYSDWTEADGTLAMVTLTLPGDWLAIAPDGSTFKKLLDKFRKRWIRAVGAWRCLWKLEFQRRGAPHMHLLMRVPALVTWDGGYRAQLGYTVVSPFEEWLSTAWATVCAASTEWDRLDSNGEPSSEYTRHLAAGTGVDFSGEKFSDPRRIALYFLGHSMKGPDGKEYQHIVPEEWQAPGKGPGRFWGFAGFERAVVELELSLHDWQVLARQFRKLQRARDWKATLVQRRGRAKDTGREVSAVTHRWSKYSKATRAMGAGGSVLGGWVLLNDALPVIQNYTSWLETR